MEVKVLDKSGNELGVIQVNPDRPILHSIGSAIGSPIQIGCKGGGCGVCKSQIVQGSYTAKRMSKAHISEDELSQGIVLTCRVIPESDLTLVVLPLEKEQTTSV